MRPDPPRLARRLLAWSLPPDEREAVVGDFAEEYASRLAQTGPAFASRWYWLQTVRSLGANLARRRKATADSRAGRRTTWVSTVEAVATDVRYAIRSLRATPGLSIVALIVLTLGIGATTAIFSVVDAVVLRALPFDEHDQLVAVGDRFHANPDASANDDPSRLIRTAPQNYADWVAQQQVFESIAAVTEGGFALREDGTPPEQLKALRVTAGFFNVLRIQPALGRTFAADNEVQGRHRVAILSDGFWRRRFGGDPGIVGKTLALDGGAYEIIGVMPRGVMYPVGAARPTELWVPYVVPDDQRVRKPTSYSRYLESIARLKPGVSLGQAQEDMDRIAASIRRDNPDISWVRQTYIGVLPLHDHLVGASTKSWMLWLLGCGVIVLLIACANVANLLLARASLRERDLAVRAALGAGRWRITRQLLAESLVLSVAGAALAIVAGWWTVQVLRGAMPEGVPRVATIALDLRVLAFAVALSLVTGLLFGIVPALLHSRPDLTTSLKDGTRGTSAGKIKQVGRGVLVVAEVALAVVLLVGAALFVGSFITVMRIDPGFVPDRVLMTSLEPSSSARATMERILERVEQIPGVESAALITGGAPLGGAYIGTTLAVVPGDLENSQSIDFKTVTPNYHHVMGIPLKRGRLLQTTDRRETLRVILIDETAAATFFPGQDPVGRVVYFNGGECTIAGVVTAIHDRGLEVDPVPVAYQPMAQMGQPNGELVVRTAGDSRSAAPGVRAILMEAMPDVPVPAIEMLGDVVSAHTAQRRLNMLLLGLFGVLGLVISAVGVYGVLAAIVAQRTREIGVRLALGATRRNVIRMVLARTSGLVVIGLAIGGAVAWQLGQIAEAFLFGIAPTDTRAFAVAVAALVFAALMASVVPARRAASVDPIVALRSE